MARPRTYRTEGVVLRQVPIGEADRILTLFSDDHGKLRAVARGVRRAKSKLSGHTEQLTHVRISVAVGKSLDVVTEAETIHGFRNLKKDLRRLSEALYLAELVDGFTVEQSPSLRTYQLLLDALTALDTSESVGTLVRCFELHLLVHSGFGPELRDCVECRKTLDPGDHLFSCERGGALCRQCRTTSAEALLPLSLNAMKILRFFEREPLSRAVNLSVSGPLLGETERLLGTYVRHVLDRETKSAEFMRLVASTESKRIRYG